MRRYSLRLARYLLTTSLAPEGLVTMGRVILPLHRVAFAVLAVIATSLAGAPAVRALDARELAGWWIAIDGTFPKLWAQHGLAPVEEILFINPDGRVQNRVLNFWAGTPQACVERNVCSDLPIATAARLRIGGDRLSFTGLTSSDARLDANGNDAPIRRELVTTTADWTVTAEQDRIALRAAAGKLRVLARIEPERLRRIYAGMRASGFSAAETWRCYLANATARDNAFAPLRVGRSTTTPEFLDHYLDVATYVVAIRSAIGSVAIDESDPERSKLLAPGNEVFLVQQTDDILMPPFTEERERLTAVLSYVERHIRALTAASAAKVQAAQAATRADATTREAEQLAAVVAAAKSAAANAQAKARMAAVALVAAQTDAAIAAQESDLAERASHVAQANSTAREQAAKAAVEAYDAARLAADVQQQKSEAANAAAVTAKKRHEAATLVLAAAERRSARLSDVARNLASAVSTMRQPADDAVALLERSKALAQQAADAAAESEGRAAPQQEAAEAARKLAAAVALVIDALNAATAARDRGNADAEFALAAQANARTEVEAAATVLTKSNAEAQTAAELADKLAALAQDAGRLAAQTKAIATAAAAALERANADAQTAAEEQLSHTRTLDTAKTTAAAAELAANAAKAAYERARAAADFANDAAAAAQAAARADADSAAAAQAAEKVAADSQPQGERMRRITPAQIAAFASVRGGGDEAKALFCRDDAVSPVRRR